MPTIQPLATREGPRQALMRLVAEQPIEVWGDARRLAALLRDYCPTSKREILALQLAQQERLVEDLQRLHGQLPVPALIARLAGHLQERAGLTESLATWSLTSWACALGYLADDGLDPSNSETVVNAGAQTFSSSAKTIAPADPYHDLLLAAKRLLDSATANASLEDAVAASEQALRLVTDSLSHAPSHASLQALAVQARAETTRRLHQLAQAALAAGDTTRATEHWQRLLELVSDHREARAGLQALNQEYAQGLTDAKALWDCGKLPSAIASLEGLRKRFPHREELRQLIVDRQRDLVEIQAIREEIPGLKQAGRLQRLQAVYDRLEKLATIPGLAESRQVLANQLAQAEPTLGAARTAIQAAEYDDAVRHASFVLTRLVDHVEAQQLHDQASAAKAALLANLQHLQTALRNGDTPAAEESYAKLSPAEQQLPALLLPYASLKALRASKSQRRQRLLSFTVGLALWISAGWLTQWTAPRWLILLGQLPASWPTESTINWIAQVIQGLIASFLLGTSAALLRGKGEFQAIFWLLGATLAQLVLGGGWLYAVTVIPTLDQQFIHVVVRGLLFGLWILVAQRVCLTSSQRSWLYGAVGCLVGSGLILASQSLPESWHSDARHLLLTASLWMTTVLAIGWIGMTRFVLIPLALALAALVSPTLATPALLPVSWGITAILLTLALLPLAAKQLARWQIALVFPLSFLAAAAANQLVHLSAPPDLFALAMLWCWTWLPVLRTN